LLRATLMVLGGAMGACAPRATVAHCDPQHDSSGVDSSVVHLVNVPFFPDNTDQCGPSSLASILNFWGKSVTPAELKSEVYVKRLGGSLPMDMLPALEAHGMQAHIISGSFEDMKTELRAGRPLIAYLDFGTRRHPIGHYVVVIGYDDHRRGLYIHSSLSRDKFASYRRFNRGWKDTDHWLLLASPTKGPTVARSTASVVAEATPSGGKRMPAYHPALSAREYTELGTIYASEGNKQDATAQYKLALSVDKRYAPAWTALGNDAFEAKNFRAAENYFQHALKINPNDPTANNNLAMVYLERNKKLGRAEALATKALSSDLRPYAYDTLAHIYLRRGEEDRAHDAWKNAVASAAGNDQLIQQLNKNAEILKAAPARDQVEPMKSITLKNGTILEGHPRTDGALTHIDVDKIGEMTVASSAVASIVDVPEQRLWKFDLLAGYTLARGNTDSDQVSSTAKANRKTTHNETTLQGSGFYSQSLGVMAAQKYDGIARYAFSYGKMLRWYNFYKLEALHDRFALIESRLLPSTGVGYWWRDTPDFKIMAEMGIGFEHTDYTEGREPTNQAVAVPRFFVEKRLIGKSRISLDVSGTLNAGEDTGQRIDGDFHFINPISARLSVDLSVTDHYVSRPPFAARQNDMLFVSALRYSL
jgi:tetratricopeptide (TPR) repeat protein